MKLLLFSLLILTSPLVQAENATEQLNAAKEKLKSNPEDPQTNLEVGKWLLKSGRYEESLSHLQKASAVSSREASLLLAVAYGKRKDYANAIRVLESHVKKEENDAEAFELLGRAYVKMKKNDEAAQAFRKSFAINPKRRTAYEGLLDLFNKTNNNYEARALLNDMIKVFGPTPRWMSGLCRIYTLDSFLANALDVCRKAIELDPKNPENALNLGTSLKNSQKVDEAMKLLIKTANDFPESSAAQKAAGAIHDELKNWEAAVHFYLRCSKTAPKDELCWTRLGVSRFELGNYKESLEAFVRACELNPRGIGEFKRCTSLLRIKNNPTVAQEFQTAMDKCSIR